MLTVHLPYPLQEKVLTKAGSEVVLETVYFDGNHVLYANPEPSDNNHILDAYNDIATVSRRVLPVHWRYFPGQEVLVEGLEMGVVVMCGLTQCDDPLNDKQFYFVALHDGSVRAAAYDCITLPRRRPTAADAKVALQTFISSTLPA